MDLDDPGFKIPRAHGSYYESRDDGDPERLTSSSHSHYRDASESRLEIPLGQLHLTDDMSSGTDEEEHGDGRSSKNPSVQSCREIVYGESSNAIEWNPSVAKKYFHDDSGEEDELEHEDDEPRLEPSIEDKGRQSRAGSTSLSDSHASSYTEEALQHRLTSIHPRQDMSLLFLGMEDDSFAGGSDDDFDESDDYNESERSYGMAAAGSGGGSLTDRSIGGGGGGPGSFTTGSLGGQSGSLAGSLNGHDANKKGAYESGAIHRKWKPL